MLDLLDHVNSVMYNVPAIELKLKQQSEKTHFFMFPRAVEASTEATADQQRSGHK